MRHSYTPMFRDVLTSRVWALPDAQLRVWLWLTLNADPEGFVCADLAGVAVAARVSAQDAREALDVLALPDADADPADPFEGRIIERVRRGWRVLVAEDNRELAKSEAKKARQRRYMKAARVADGAAANDTTHAELTCEPAELPVDAPKPTPKSKPKPKPSSEDGGDLPLPPQGLLREVQGTPTVWRTLDGWTLSPELRSEALMAGLSDTDIDAHVARLRNGPIGGNRGVLDRDAYVRGMFGKWRAWGEADRAKAQAATTGNRREVPGGDIATTAAASAFSANGDHLKFCAKHNLDAIEAVSAYRKGTRPAALGTVDAWDDFMNRLKCWAATGAFHADGPLPKPTGVRGLPPWVLRRHLEYLAGDRATLKVYAERFIQERDRVALAMLTVDAAAARFDEFLKTIIRGTAAPVEAA